MAQIDLGKVVGTDGFNPVINILEDTVASYRLSIRDKTHTIVTPNLRGVTAKHFVIPIEGRGKQTISLPELGLDPDREYAFFAAAGTDYPLLREITAIRADNMLELSVYYDTMPYTEPQVGSPFTGSVAKVGTVGRKIGIGKVGEEFISVPFMVVLLCFEIIPDGRIRVKIGDLGLKIGDFQIGQEISPEQ